MKYMTLSILVISALTAFGQKKTGNNNFSIQVDGELAFRIRMKDAAYHFDGSLFLDKADNYSFKVDCGTYNFNEQPVYKFKFKNYTDTPLIIVQAHWGEPFLSPEYAKEPILKGRTGVVAYTARHIGRTGSFSKTAYVSTNRDQFIVSFTGNILPPTLFLDKSFTMQEPGEDKKIHTEFAIWNKGMEHFKVDSIRTDKNTVVEAGMVDPEGKQVFKVTHKPAGKGNSVSRVTVFIHGIKVEHDLFVKAVLPAKKP